MKSAPRTWIRLSWPREVALEQQLGALAVLASMGEGPLLLSSTATSGLVVHDLAVPSPSAPHVARQLLGIVPGLSTDELPSAPVVTIDRAVHVRLSTKNRQLATDHADITSRATLAALSHVGNNETVRLLWWLGTPLRPFAVPNHLDAIPSDSWLKDLAFAALGKKVPVDPERRNALRTKQALPGWKAAGYIGVHASGHARQRQLIRQVLSALRTVQAPGVAFWVRSASPERVSAPRLPWIFPLRLNVAEVAALSTWPAGKTGDLPVASQRARLLPPSPVIPQHGRVIGLSTYPGSQRPLAISSTDSLRHAYAIGPSGVGKSSLLAHMIQHDIEEGRAVVVIEPKDLIAEVLAHVPEYRINDVVLVSAKSSEESFVGINPLSSIGQHPELVADQLLAVFKSLYGQMLGPRTTDLLAAALHTLVLVPDATLVSLPLILSDPIYRRKCLAYVNDPIALEPFWATFDALTDAARTEIISPLLNKVRPLLLRPQLRAVLGQSKSLFNVRDVFTKKRILLVDCAKGELGSEVSSLIGSIVVSLVWNATLERTALDPRHRHPVSIYIDEFQEFLRLPTDLGDALAQARGLSVGFTLANQYLHQLNPAISSAVLANAQNRICFHVADEDARVLSAKGSGLEAEDFANLGAYEFYARLVAGAAIQPWCSGKTFPPASAISDPVAVKAASLQNYGRSRSDIEAEILALTQHSDAADHSDFEPRPRSRRPS